MPAIQLPEKLERVLTTAARLVVLIGGRSSAKSETMARVLTMKAQTERADVLCGREYQNSIDDSVHKLIKGVIENLKLRGFRVTDKKIDCKTGGGFRFKGFARNPEAVKSAQDFKYSWVEEAQSMSQESIDSLLPTIRAHGSKLFFTANPQASGDPFSQRFIVPYLPDLLSKGFYEDDLHLVIMVNWRDNPWHEVLEPQRLWDFKHLSRAKYDHIWEGAFNDTVDFAIIRAEWFDAAVDAHITLGFTPRGEKVLAHDPSDEGEDPKGLAYRHGSVFFEVSKNDTDDVNEGCDWALDFAITNQVDRFIWDGDGMGIALKRQVETALKGKHVKGHIFRGSEGPAFPYEVYQGAEFRTDKTKEKTNKETFKNKRAQHYWYLRDRFYKTFLAVTTGAYIDPEDLISISSEIEELRALRSELCRIPQKPNPNGMIQIMSKIDMRAKKISSPNMADAMMMSLAQPEDLDGDNIEVNFTSWN